MTQEEYIDSKVTTMTDLSGKKSKVLLLKNETEIESFKKQLALCNVSCSLPTKKYEIDFGGDVLAGLEITKNEPKITGAINGWGNGISKDDITITEK